MKISRYSTLGVITVLLLSGLAVTGCAPKEEGPAMFAVETPPPPPPYNADNVGAAITEASGSTPQTTIYTNVFNGSGGSCVDAATRRGTAIADKLQGMKNTGQIPSDHTVEVHTYSGYRVPFISDASLHTYTVTQVKGPDGAVKDTWTSDNYLGPNSTTHYTGDGGYTNWSSDYLTSPVNPTNAPPPPPKPKPTRDKSGSGGGGGGGGGGSGGGGGGGGEG